MLKGYLRLADNGNDSDECTCRYVRLFKSNISYKLSLINISQSYMYTYVCEKLFLEHYQKWKKIAQNLDFIPFDQEQTAALKTDCSKLMED